MNWLNVPDYTIVNVCNQSILCIGGATSIDRLYRKDIGAGYWSDEYIKYQPKVEGPVNIICTHSAPSFCFPNDKGGIVYEYAQYDLDLLKDIDEERATMDMIYEDYKDEVTHWYYGHFHKSQMQTINNTMFKLLNIGEICRHYVPDNNNLL